MCGQKYWQEKNNIDTLLNHFGIANKTNHILFLLIQICIACSRTLCSRLFDIWSLHVASTGCPRTCYIEQVTRPACL